MGQPRPLFVYFRSFQLAIITIFTTNKCDAGAGIRTHDLWNITTRPGLRPQTGYFALTSKAQETIMKYQLPP